MSTTAPIDGSSVSSGKAERTIERCGGPYCSSVRRSDVPASAPAASSSMTGRGHRLGTPAGRVGARSVVAVHDRALSVEHENAEAERVDGASHALAREHGRVTFRDCVVALS